MNEVEKALAKQRDEEIKNRIEYNKLMKTMILQYITIEELKFLLKEPEFYSREYNEEIKDIIQKIIYHS